MHVTVDQLGTCYLDGLATLPNVTDIPDHTRHHSNAAHDVFARSISRSGPNIGCDVGTSTRIQRHREAMGLDQIGITLSGVIAVWLTQDKRAARRRWACIFGMLAQPFWFYAAWRAEQWGIFAMCTLYSYAWARGLWVHWISHYSHGLGVRFRQRACG